MASRVLIPQLELEQNNKPIRKVVEKGAKQISTQVVQATAFGNNGATFSFQPPSQNTVLDRRIDIIVPITLTHAGRTFQNQQAEGNANTTNCGYSSVVQYVNAAAGAPAATVGALQKVSNNLAPRQFPLNSMIDNIDLTLNGTHFTTDIDNYLHPLMKYTGVEYRNNTLQTCYHHPDDTSGTYDRGLGDSARGFTDASCLSVESKGGRLGEQPRGHFWAGGVGLVNTGEVVRGDVGATGNASLRWEFCEPLMISPLAINYGKGMSNINNVEVTVRFRQNLNYCLSLYVSNLPKQVAGGSGLTAAGMVVAVGQPSLRIRNFTPQDDIEIPTQLILDYEQPRRFFTSQGGVARNVATTTTGNNRRLDQIPESIVLWACPRFQDQNIEAPNAYAQITNVNITFGNQVGILSGLNARQLLELAVENGCDIASETEAREVGFPLKLNFGKDIPLMNNESPGTRGDYNIQITLTYAHDVVGNLGGTAAVPNIDVNELYINNGQVIISPNECRVQTGLLDMKDNIEAEDMGQSYNEVSQSEMGGGSLFSKHKGYYKKVPHLFRQAVKHLPQAYDTAMKIKGAYEDPSISNIMSSAGAVRDLIKNVRGGSEVGGSNVGGSIVGGKGGMYHSRRK